MKKREGSTQGMRESKKQEIEVSRSRLTSQIRMERLRSQDVV
jgi:hypothetical protein